MYIKRFQLVWVWLQFNGFYINHKHFCVEGDITSAFEIKKGLQLHCLPPWAMGTSRSLLLAAIFDCTFSFLRLVGNVCGPYVDIFFFFFLSDTYIWMVYDKDCYLERTPHELEMGYMGEMRLDYEITFNIRILENRLVLVKEPCKSTIVVDLHIFRWYSIRQVFKSAW